MTKRALFGGLCVQSVHDHSWQCQWHRQVQFWQACHDCIGLGAPEGVRCICTAFACMRVLLAHRSKRLASSRTLRNAWNLPLWSFLRIFLRGFELSKLTELVPPRHSSVDCLVLQGWARPAAASAARVPSYVPFCIPTGHSCLSVNHADALKGEHLAEPGCPCCGTRQGRNTRDALRALARMACVAWMSRSSHCVHKPGNGKPAASWGTFGK
jgi:hypothetical protein